MRATILFLALVACIMFTTFANAKWTLYCTRSGECPDTVTDIAVVEIDKDKYSACIVGGYSASPDEDNSTGLWCAKAADLSDLTRLKHHNSSAVQMALAVSEKGAIATTGMGFFQNSHIMHSLDHVNAFNSKVVLGAFGQDIKSVRSDRAQDRQLFASCGTMDVLYGGQAIFLSDNSGRSFVNATWDPTITYGDARYIHGFYGPTQQDNVIFVSGGTWPSSSSPEQEHKDLLNRCIRMSEKICQPAPKSMSFAAIKKANSRIYTELKKSTAALRANDPNGGYIGIITATSDSGKTWRKLYETNELYFNDIHCSSPQNCIVVGERQNTAYIYVTIDGGQNWTQTYDISSTLLVSLFRVRFVDDKTAYATGGYYDEARENFFGLVLKTTDGGLTWNNEASIEGLAIVMGISFSTDGSAGYAVGSTQGGQAVIARFDRDASTTTDKPKCQ